MAAPTVTLRAEGIGMRFGGNQVLQDCGFEARDGQVVCLVGPNGAGKTTLFNIVTGFLKPNAGAVYLGDRNITRLSPSKRVDLGLARTFQLTRVFQRMTVRENILLATAKCPGTHPVAALAVGDRRPSDVDDRVEEIAASTGIATKLDRRVGNLGYAEQKLVTIAQLIATGARVLLLDEPAAGLDRASVSRLLGIVKGFATEGRTVVLVEHSVEIVKEVADHVVFLHQGRVFAQGTPAEIVSDEELRSVYFGLRR